jgi:hypothetical protein
MDHVTCKQCNCSKKTSEFRICKDKKYAREYPCSWCRECEKAKSLKRYHEKKEACQAKNKEYKAAHAEEIKEKRKVYLEKTKDHVKQRYKKYCANNREKLNSIAKQYKQNHPHIQIHCCLSSRLRSLLAKGKHTEDYLGAPVNLVMQWFEFNFGDKYSWDNRSNVWHIDHVLPAVLFDMNVESDVELCFSWMNLIPLDKTYNLKKQGKLDFPRILWQELRLRQFAAKHNLQHIIDPFIKSYAEKVDKLSKCNTTKLREPPESSIYHST